MPATDEERLLIRIEAQLRQFERAMKQATGSANKAAGQIENRFTVMERKLAGIGRTFGVGFLAGGIAVLPGVIRDVVREAANLGDTADRIGITTDRLQELNYQAQQTGSSAATMATALEQFGKRIGEAASKGGDLAKLFEANGVAIRDSAGNLRPFNDLLNDFINLVSRSASESERLAVAALGFGRGAGAEMALTFRDGAEGAERFANEAQRLGQILGGDLIRRAQDIDDRFDQLAGTLATFAQSEVLRFVSDLADEFERLSGWLDAVRQAAEPAAGALSEIVGGSAGGLQAELDDVTKSISDLEASVAGFGAGAPQVMIAELEALRAKAAELRAEMAATSAAVNSYDPLSSIRAPVRPTILPSGGGRGGGTGTGRRRSSGGGGGGVSEIEREKKAVVELIAELQREQSLVGASETTKRISNELRRAGAAATEDQKAQITSLITEIDAEEAANQRLIETLDEVRFAASSALDAFSQSIINGEGAAEGLKAALVDVLQTIIEIGQQQAISSLFGAAGGPGLGILGRLFRGFRAAGGPVSPNRAYVVGEKRPEIFMPSSAGRILPDTGGSKVAVDVNVKPSPLLIATWDRRAAEAEDRAVARGPALARDQQRRYGTP